MGSGNTKGVTGGVKRQWSGNGGNVWYIKYRQDNGEAKMSWKGEFNF